jgi:hypothetical protein
VESNCILFVIERTEVYPQLMRGEATGKGSEDVGSECLDQYHQGMLDDFSIEMKLFGSNIRWWLEVLEDYLLRIKTNKQVLYLRLPYLVVVGSSKFYDTISSNRGSSFDNWKDRLVTARGRSRGRHF